MRWISCVACQSARQPVAVSRRNMKWVNSFSASYLFAQIVNSTSNSLDWTMVRCLVLSVGLHLTTPHYYINLSVSGLV